jgi:hypothetical protein
MPQPWRLPLVLLAMFGVARVMAAPPAQIQPSSVTLRIIIVSSADEAARVADRLKAGENFAALAKALSIDPSAVDGGLLGSLDPAMLRPEMHDALRGVSIGQVTPVITVPAGFALLKVVADSEASGSGIDATNPGLTAVGSVKYVMGVAGLNEVLASLDRYPKPADWNVRPSTICDARRGSHDAIVKSLEALVRPGAPVMPPHRLMQVHYALGQVYSYSGRMAETIDQFSRAYALVEAGSSAADPAAVQIQEALGVAWLHKAEMDNEVYHRPGDRCLLSPAGLKPFERTEASTKAIEHFLRYLAHKPQELEVKWLLNIAYMTIGGYPDKVPPEHLVPPKALESAEDVGRFVDVAAEAGLRSFSLAGASIVDDFDNDGRFDVVTSSFESCTPVRFFRRLADGGFSEEGAKAGLGDQLGGLNAVQADYDNDGCLDILLMRGAWDRAQRKSLLRNSCKGSFTDVTVASGVAQPISSTQAAVWSDIDNDGFLDLFVGNEASEAQLYLNKRDGTFVDIGASAGVARTAFTKGVATFDFDNDGWQDLYASNLSGDSFLYRNNRNRTFTEMGRALGAPGSQKAFVSWAFDYDNDGWEDLFVTSYFTSVEETARTYLALPHNATTLKLYRNRGDGSFLDVTKKVGLDKVFMPMGSNFGDIDNDGWLDIYLGTGNPSYASLIPSVLLRNREGKRFVDVTASSGTGELHKGHGVAFADLDNDGDQEIVFEVGGAVPGDAHALRLFRNPGHGNDWLSLRLVGVKSNRNAIGARIAVTVEGPAGRRVVHRTVSSGGSFGASPLTQHIGLGRVNRIAEVEVRWPSTGAHQKFVNLQKNQAFEITEFAETPKRLVRPALPLGTVSSSAEKQAR